MSGRCVTAGMLHNREVPRCFWMPACISWRGRLAGVSSTITWHPRWSVHLEND